jgi:hypothetical protein
MNIDLPTDYQLSDGEIDNIVYLTCKYTVGWQSRSVDVSVMKLMLGTTVRGKEAVTKLVENTCEYVSASPTNPPRKTFTGTLPLCSRSGTRTPPWRNAPSQVSGLRAI